MFISDKEDELDELNDTKIQFKSQLCEIEASQVGSSMNLDGIALWFSKFHAVMSAGIDNVKAKDVHLLYAAVPHTDGIQKLVEADSECSERPTFTFGQKQSSMDVEKSSGLGFVDRSARRRSASAEPTGVVSRRARRESTGEGDRAPRGDLGRSRSPPPGSVEGR